jgi:hypothetical protein
MGGFIDLQFHIRQVRAFRVNNIQYSISKCAFYIILLAMNESEVLACRYQNFRYSVSGTIGGQGHGHDRGSLKEMTV